MKKLTTLIILCNLSLCAFARSIYVDANGTGDYPTIQTAIDDANDNDEIILLQGTYTGDGNRDIDFLSKEITVRSTDSLDPCVVAATIIDCQGDPCDPHRGFYFYSGEDANSVLSGLTITNGYGPDEGSYSVGGAIYCKNSSPTLTNCTFRKNSTSGWGIGGGLYNSNSNPTVINCTFDGNLSRVGGGMSNRNNSSPIVLNSTFTNNMVINSGGGGGIFTSGGSPMVVRCTFSGNCADSHEGYGGAMDIDGGSTATVSNCTFQKNSATGQGGGMVVFNDSSPTVSNCLFVHNKANDMGAAIAHFNTSLATIANCTFVGNSSPVGQTMSFDHNPSGPHGPSNIEVTNCILWSGDSEIWNNDGSTITVTHSDVQGGWPGTGNIDVDPCFVVSGYWDPNGTPTDTNDDFWVNGDYHLKPESLCINAGDPNYVPGPNETDLDGLPRIIGDRIDMGCYEFRQPCLKAKLFCMPRCINTYSRRRNITAFLCMPQGITPDDIDANEPLLFICDSNEVESTRQFVWQWNKHGRPCTLVIASFNRSLCMDILSLGLNRIKVSGRLRSGQCYYGNSYVYVYKPRPFWRWRRPPK